MGRQQKASQKRPALKDFSPVNVPPVFKTYIIGSKKTKSIPDAKKKNQEQHTNRKERMRVAYARYHYGSTIAMPSQTVSVDVDSRPPACYPVRFTLTRSQVEYPITPDERFIHENWTNTGVFLDEIATVADMPPRIEFTMEALQECMDQSFAHAPRVISTPLKSSSDICSPKRLISMTKCHRFLRALCNVPIIISHKHSASCKTECVCEPSRERIRDGVHVVEPTTLGCMFVPMRYLDTLRTLKQVEDPSIIPEYPELVEWMLMSEILIELLTANTPIDCWDFPAKATSELKDLITIFITLGPRPLQPFQNSLTLPQLNELVASQCHGKGISLELTSMHLTWLVRLAERLGPSGIKKTLSMAYTCHVLLQSAYEPHSMLLWPHREKFHRFFHELEKLGFPYLLPPNTNQPRNMYGIVYAELISSLYLLYWRDYQVAQLPSWHQQHADVYYPYAFRLADTKRHDIQQHSLNIFGVPIEGFESVQVIELDNWYHAETFRNLFEKSSLIGPSIAAGVYAAIACFQRTVNEFRSTGSSHDTRDRPYHQLCYSSLLYRDFLSLRSRYYYKKNGQETKRVTWSPRNTRPLSLVTFVEWLRNNPDMPSLIQELDLTSEHFTFVLASLHICLYYDTSCSDKTRVHCLPPNAAFSNALVQY